MFRVYSLGFLQLVASLATVCRSCGEPCKKNPCEIQIFTKSLSNRPRTLVAFFAKAKSLKEPSCRSSHPGHLLPADPRGHSPWWKRGPSCVGIFEGFKTAAVDPAPPPLATTETGTFMALTTPTATAPSAVV